MWPYSYAHPSQPMIVVASDGTSQVVFGWVQRNFGTQTYWEYVRIK